VRGRRLVEALGGPGGIRTANLALTEIAALDALLNEISKSSVACQIRASIPGVGAQAAAAFAAAVDDADRFNRSRAAGA
jgi:transposase